ncbi:MAG: bifunctional 4-hydroxy-2-oxoglutarate aldolase/2-dehydro-3-deoxy-phosphogluconate aldolase [bacterium]|nr:bifunctional 4-hydroxy-2-oxoglutarate aldolase/2-dehydro-3-deoxy-phosphogluconate aldolase [bacterium]
MISTSGFSAELLEELHRSRVIAVLMVDNVCDAVPLARALLDGGINIIELTLRTPIAIEALIEIRRKVPEMIVGIGTILTVEQLVAVKTAGAAFGVAPGFNPRVVTKAQEISFPFAPGICTPSDIEAALERGCRVLKFFPAEACGGLKSLKAMQAPYAHLDISYIPLGGLDQDNFLQYLQYPAVVAVGGSWIAMRGEISANDWKAITAKAIKARELIDSL